jgi:osmoprotectant transport system permease protein
VAEQLQNLWDYLTSDAAWSGRSGLPSLFAAHVRLSVTAVLIAAIIAIPPAVALGHIKRGGFIAVSTVNIGRAIPSFAAIALIYSVSSVFGFGLGFWPTALALVLLAAPPIFTNTYIGVRDAPADAVEAARGMGMRAGQLVRRVEGPVALPLILTGLRVSSVQVVATATLGPLVGFRDLGTPIITGFQTPNKGPLLAGAIAVILLALLTDAAFAIAGRWLVPWRARASGRVDDATVSAPDLIPSAIPTSSTGPTPSTP